LLDRVLLVLILVEILHTVVLSLERACTALGDRLPAEARSPMYSGPQSGPYPHRPKP
jgi:hypothetical protein